MSVIVCTRNRSASLARLFRSMSRLRLPEGLRWELLLIDNGSSDDTRSMADGFRGELPIRYVEHRAAGIAHARNRGLDEAQGSYICWTDDDTTVAQDWLSSYIDAFARHPEASVFGGPIIPVLAEETPAWIVAQQHRWPLDCIVGSIDPGAEELPIGRKPWGANWAVRAAACRAERFDAMLGWSPSQARVGEETDMIHRLFRNGAVGWWVPGAKLNHFVSGGPITWSRVHRYYGAKGGTDAYILDRSPGSNWVVDGRSRLLDMSTRGICARILWHGFFHAFWRLLYRKPRALRSLARCSYFSGVARYQRTSRHPVNGRRRTRRAPPAAIDGRN